MPKQETFIPRDGLDEILDWVKWEISETNTKRAWLQRHVERNGLTISPDDFDIAEQAMEVLLQQFRLTQKALLKLR